MQVRSGQRMTMLRWLLVAALAAAMAPAAAGGAAPPELKAKQAQARSVLKQVNALDIRFGKVVDSWDGARGRLAATEKRLAANKVALTRARAQTRVAEQRLAQRLVAIYEADGEPTLVEALVGARSLGEIVDRVEAVKTISAYDRRLADAALRAQLKLAAARTRLRATERERRATVTRLGVERKRISSMLAQRRRLLSSIRTEMAAIRKRERARQAALAAAARVRLAKEAAARAAAERAAAQRLAAEQAKAATDTVPTTTQAVTTAAPAATTPAATTTAPAPADLPAGHPQAAQIALHYLGIPYHWGGDSPATGFDCSGLVMYVYEQLGIALPHQSQAQYQLGVAVPRDQLQPGDLVFFDGLSHVGIYIGNGQMVHAPQTGDVVKITPLSSYAGSRYVGARRI